MIPDDDSFLSAYLDGQLGPEEQQAVEAALLDDPRLAEELRGLVVVRDLLAGLPREAPGDLTSRVMRRVRRRARLGKARGLVVWGPARAAGLAAIAAGVLAMLTASFFLPGHDGRAVAPPPGPPLVEKPRPPLSVAQWPPFAPHDDRKHEVEDAPPEERRPSPTDPVADSGSGQDELVHVRKYLDHPNLRRIFLVSDAGDGSDERQVASVVEQTTHYNYYKITISQGIMLDPRHPEQATVFALVVDPGELDSLRDRLHAALKDRVDEEAAEPGAVTQLAAIDRVEACPPIPPADMQIPREALAFRAGDAGVSAAALRAEAPEPPDRPTREQERSAPIAELLERENRAGNRANAGRPPAVPAGQGAGGRPAGPKDDMDQTLVVLVWVSRPRPG